MIWNSQSPNAPDAAAQLSHFQFLKVHLKRSAPNMTENKNPIKESSFCAWAVGPHYKERSTPTHTSFYPTKAESATWKSKVSKLLVKAHYLVLTNP